MKTIKSQDGVVVEKFADIYEFSDTIAERKQSSAFKYQTDSQEVRSSSTCWYGTATYAEADHLLQYGYEQGVQAINAVASILGNSDERLTRVAPVGAVPHIPNFIAGVPCNMIYRQRIERPKKVINIYFDRGASSSVSTEDITTASARLLDLVEFLERRGYSVNVETGSTTVLSDAYSTETLMRTTRTLSIKIKDGRTNSTNRRKVAYLLVHPSFLRRHIFRWLETHPNHDVAADSSGYGYPLYAIIDDFKKRRQFYIDHGVITEDDYYFDIPALRKLSSSDEILPLLNEQSRIA